VHLFVALLCCTDNADWIGTRVKELTEIGRGGRAVIMVGKDDVQSGGGTGYSNDQTNGGSESPAFCVFHCTFIVVEIVASVSDVALPWTLALQ
jgi:hypothetical protein